MCVFVRMYNVRLFIYYRYYYSSASAQFISAVVSVCDEVVIDRR